VPGSEENEIRKRLKTPNRLQDDHGWTYYICPVCKKEFTMIGKTGWAYKKKIRNQAAYNYFCDYNCMRKAERILNGTN
jgi:hypothetical protein